MSARRPHRAVLGVCLSLAVTVAWLTTAQQAPAQFFSGTLYLHGDPDSLKGTSPTSLIPLYRDSPALTDATFEPIGTWSTARFAASTELRELGAFRGWAGIADAASSGAN